MPTNDHLSLSHAIEQAAANLSVAMPFAHYKLNLPTEAINAMDGFSVNCSRVEKFNEISTENEYKYYAFRANSSEVNQVEYSLAKFIKHVSVDGEDAEYKAETIANSIKTIFTAASYNNYPYEITMLEVRVQSAKNLCGFRVDGESWHVDAGVKGCQYSNIITLAGSKTLFYNDQILAKQSLSDNINSCAFSTPLYITDYTKVETAAFDHGTAYLPHYALHSAPFANNDEDVNDRLFVRIDQCLESDPNLYGAYAYNGAKGFYNVGDFE